MTRLVVAEIPENANRDLDVERAILGPDIEIVRYSYRGNDDELHSICGGADVILTDFVPFDRRTIAALQTCKLISVAATGYDGIDLVAAEAAGVSVCAVDEYCTDEVADHAILLMLALCRRLTEYHAQVQQQSRWEFDSLTGLRRLRDMTLGIVGFGRIGQAVARRAVAFGLTIIACDPAPDATAAAGLGTRFCELPELLATSDIISLNCGLTPGNSQLIDEQAIATMLRKPILINCARGGLVDEVALATALDNGQISAAGLDVLTEESPNLKATRLTGRDNVILTPHVAFYSDASMLENRQLSAANIRNFLDGRHVEVRQYIHHADSRVTSS